MQCNFERKLFFKTNSVYNINQFNNIQFLLIMEEKKITEHESIELIAAMISNTKKRMKLGNGNVLLAWGYVTTIVALAVGCGYSLSHDINWYWLWFAIPVIGYPLHLYLARKNERNTLVKTSIDRFINHIWTAIGIYFLIMMIVCLAFGFNGHNAWGAMYLLTLPCCGFGAIATGVILQEKSLLTGGVLSMLTGGVFIICVLCHIDIFCYDVFAFTVCFALMMIIPGHIINHKARLQQ